VYVRALAAMGTARSPLLIIVIRYSGSDAGFVTLSQFLHKLSERDISRCCEVTPAARLRFAAAIALGASIFVTESGCSC
jgi:hypothetical protein